MSYMQRGFSKFCLSSKDTEFCCNESKDSTSICEAQSKHHDRSSTKSSVTYTVDVFLQETSSVQCPETIMPKSFSPTEPTLPASGSTEFLLSKTVSGADTVTHVSYYFLCLERTRHSESWKTAACPLVFLWAERLKRAS